jgi:hypothetical protein
VSKLTADQMRRRDRVESGIRLVAPVLNLVLAVGERLSRIVEPDDPEYYPARVETDKADASGALHKVGQE